MSYINVFGGGTVQSADTSYARYDISAANLVLSWPIEFQNTQNVVYDFMNILSTNPGRTIKLPDARLVSVGVSFKFINVGGVSIGILDNQNNLIVTVNVGQAWELYLTDKSTSAGVWGFLPTGNGTSGVVSFNSVQPAAGLVVSQNATTGAIIQTFTLANDLLALENLTGQGFAVRTGTDAWSLRTITQGANITITNPAGTAGNTVVALNTTLTGMVAITVGNINLTTNVISGTQANQNIIITPNGTGELQSSKNLNIQSANELKFYNAFNTFYTGFSAGAALANTNYVWPTVYPSANNQVLASSTAGVMSWVNAVTSPGATTTNAIAKYLNTSGQLANSGIFIDNLNNMTGATSITAQNIGIGTIAGIAGSGTNVISAVAGTDIILNPINPGIVVIMSSASIEPIAGAAQGLLFSDGASINGVVLRARDAAMGARTTYILPSTPPTLAGQILSASVPVANDSTTSWTTPAVVQMVSTASSTATSTAATMPYNNTIPQIGDGTELITVTITPRYTGRLVIEFTANISNTSNQNDIILGLFQDATANALTAGAFFNNAGTTAFPLILRHVIAAAVANVSTTFRIRYGVSVAGTAYILTGNGATNTMGGVPQMSLTVTEYGP